MVCDIGANHGGSLLKAKKLIYAAKKAGADAVKLQTYTPAELSNRPNFAQYREVYEKYHTPREWHRDLFDCARDWEITIFSSAFSVDGVNFLADLGAPAIKIASAEAVDEELVDAAMATGLPVITSMGRSTNVRGDILLHCVSRYPTMTEDANLGAMRSATAIRQLVGLSDHTPDDTTAIMATALGAVMIEKHFKLDDDCVDAAYSLNPGQFKAMCDKVRAGWQAMQ